MANIITKSSGGDFELIPAGQYSAVCYRVVDIGTQQSTDKMGKVLRKRKLIISWEIDERMSDGKRFSHHERYTRSTHEMSSLRSMLESWRGKPFTPEEENAFDIGKLIGVPCLVQLIHNKQGAKTYVNMSSIMKLPKGMEAIKPENETIDFCLDDFNQADFDKFSTNLQETIKKSPEYIEATKSIETANDITIPSHVAEEIPF